MKPSAFEKRVKRRITALSHDFLAVCPPGLKTICKNELTALGSDIQDIHILPGGVAFTAKLALVCFATISLGSPTKVLMRIAAFKADNFSKLEKKLRQIPWELFLPGNTDLNIQVTAHKSRLYHSGAIAERCKPIIEASLSASPLALPMTKSQILSPKNGIDSNPLQFSDEPSKQTLLIRADNDQFELSLDMSGEPLFKRGIKQRVISAPLRENLAFAILKAAGFSKQDVLIDPMCGSGTFSMEAAMFQANIPPGFFRPFAFEQWPGFRKANFEYLKTKAKNDFSLATSPGIFASDIDTNALSCLDAAIGQHDFLKTVQTHKINFFDLQPKELSSKKGVVVLNPPYGKRLDQDMDKTLFFKEIGRKLAADFKGWRAGIIYPEKNLGQALGLPLRPMPFFHGGLDLFAGIGIIQW
jgi:putative N6-adenine-specific DNA methylase